MFRGHLLAGLAAAMLVFGASCSTLVTAYLVNELLNDKAPKRTWSGVVRDTTGQPVGGIDVEVRGEVEGDTNIAKYKDTTDVDGAYSISFRWNKNIQYNVRVVHDGVVLAEEQYGTVELSDRVTDFVIQGAISVELSGVVNGPDGVPLNGVVVVGASAAALDATPIVLLDQNAKTLYDMTNDSGVFSLTGTIARYGIICAYHPDYGFAYAYGEDLDGNGSIALNLQMGAAGLHHVQVQVVDGLGVSIPNQILPASRQFRLRLGTPFNLAAPVDVAVAENGLFPGLHGDPSDTHPSALTLLVQATGANGIAEQEDDVEGASYYITLLNVLDDNQATALVTSENPLSLHEDATIVVRVN